MGGLRPIDALFRSPILQARTVFLLSPDSILSERNAHVCSLVHSPARKCDISLRLKALRMQQ
jgi:hypothetical protein